MKKTRCLCYKPESILQKKTGITKNKEIASRLKEYYEKLGYSIYVKETIIESQEFLSILGEYDKILNIATDKDIKEVEKIIISNYKEMVLNNET